MSQLINIDPDVDLLPEEQGCEYGYYLFDPLPPIHTDDIYIYIYICLVLAKCVSSMKI